MKLLDHIWPWSAIRDITRIAEMLKTAVMEHYYRDRCELLEEYTEFLTRGLLDDELDAHLQSFAEWRKVRR